MIQNEAGFKQNINLTKLISLYSTILSYLPSQINFYYKPFCIVELLSYINPKNKFA